MLASSDEVPFLGERSVAGFEGDRDKFFAEVAGCWVDEEAEAGGGVNGYVCEGAGCCWVEGVGLGSGGGVEDNASAGDGDDCARSGDIYGC